MRPEWKEIIGRRLKEFRERAHGGSGFTQKSAAKTIGRTEKYLNSLETHLVDENPSLAMLEQLCSLYGTTVVDLFKPLIHEIEARSDKQHADMKEKLDFILSHGAEPSVITIVELIDAMYARTKALKTTRKKS